MYEHPGIGDLGQRLSMTWIDKLGQQDDLDPDLQTAIVTGLMALNGTETSLFMVR